MASKLKQDIAESPKVEEQKIGDFVDMILVLMSWKPYERPPPRVLLNSKLFQSDSYQLMQMKQFASVSFFYRSPSKCIREAVLLPLRRMSSYVIENQPKIVNMTEDLIKMVDLVIETLVPSNQYSLIQIKKELAVDPVTGERLLNSAIQGLDPNLALQTSQFAHMDGLTQNILNSSKVRAKNPHYHLIKYMFNFKVFDILLFLILRHHREINEMISKSGDQMIDFDKLENLYYTPLKGFKVIMQRLIFDLKSYDGAAVEYVGQILNLLVKFSVGEEFILGSEIVDIKQANILGKNLMK